VPKLQANRERDGRVHRELLDLGWQVLVIWECELKDRNEVRRRLKDFLESAS
jgi:DNA mismatch endonuclease (patch repair protein)